MIKIRYSDLPAGLHARADAQGRHVIIYLLPGLTPAQRHAALHRVRSSARMGHGPQMSAAGFACAVAADRLRITLRNGAGAMRAHPALFVPPLILFVSAAIVYVVLSSVSIRYQPEAVGPGRQVAPAVPAQGPVSTSAAGLPGLQPGSAVAPGLPGGSASTAPGKGSGQQPGGSSPSPSSPASPLPPGLSPSPSASPTPDPGDPSPQPTAPGPSSPGGPSPSPSPSPSGGNGVCVVVGPLGVCLHL